MLFSNNIDGIDFGDSYQFDIKIIQCTPTNVKTKTKLQDYTNNTN